MNIHIRYREINICTPVSSFWIDETDLYTHPTEARNGRNLFGGRKLVYIV